MSEPEDLILKLRAWKVNPGDSPGFEREVWRRIALREEPRQEPIWKAAFFDLERGSELDAHDSKSP